MEENRRPINICPKATKAKVICVKNEEQLMQQISTLEGGEDTEQFVTEMPPGGLETSTTTLKYQLHTSWPKPEEIDGSSITNGVTKHSEVQRWSIVQKPAVQKQGQSADQFSYDHFVTSTKDINFESLMCALLKWGASVSVPTIEDLQGYLYHLSVLCHFAAVGVSNVENHISYDKAVRLCAKRSGWKAFREDYISMKTACYGSKIMKNQVKPSKSRVARTKPKSQANTKASISVLEPLHIVPDGSEKNVLNLNAEVQIKETNALPEKQEEMSKYCEKSKCHSNTEASILVPELLHIVPYETEPNQNVSKPRVHVKQENALHETEVNRTEKPTAERSNTDELHGDSAEAPDWKGITELLHGDLQEANSRGGFRQVAIYAVYPQEPQDEDLREPTPEKPTKQKDAKQHAVKKTALTQNKSRAKTNKSRAKAPKEIDEKVQQEEDDTKIRPQKSDQHKCPECDKTFQWKTTLKSHMVTAHNKPGFTCSHCGYTGATASRLKIHEMTHTGQKRFFCATCGKGFYYNSTLKKHTVVHTLINDFVCSTCGKAFNAVSNFQRHMRTHTDETPFECEFCGEKFRRWNTMKVHSVKHMEDPPHTCLVCGKGFPYISLLKTHLSKRHSKVRPYGCDFPQCRMSFSEECQLNVHRLTCHPDNLNVNVKSSEPGGETSMDSSEEKFLVTSRECPLCGKVLQSIHHAKIHMRSHTGEKPYKCPQCTKGFTTQSGLRLHFLNHEGLQPFACAECGRKFGNHANLQRHMLIHTGAKPYKCDKCDKAFRQQAALKLHMKYHQGQKDFKCTECGKDFVEPATLRKHLMTHSGERPFVCEVCQKGFICKSQLNMHMKKHKSDM